jgi:hypothetical protein
MVSGYIVWYPLTFIIRASDGESCSSSMSKQHANFAHGEAWRGGSYELYIAVNDTQQLCSMLMALWSHPALEGCYRRNDCEPSEQARVTPCEGELLGHLYGLAILSNRTVVPCSSHVMDYDGEEGMPPIHSLSFAVQMGALSVAYPVGPYPFGSMDHVVDWKHELDVWLVNIANCVYERVPFQMALVGFEVNPARHSFETIQRNGIPPERDDGILWSDGQRLNWYPATRP